VHRVGNTGEGPRKELELDLKHREEDANGEGLALRSICKSGTENQVQGTTVGHRGGESGRLTEERLLEREQSKYHPPPIGG